MATFDSGTTKKYALSTADTATANIYAIQEATTAATIKLVGAGDSVYLEGLSSEYTIKATKTKVTLHSDTQTITIDLTKSTGAQKLVLIDGEFSLVKGTKAITVNGVTVSKVVELDLIDTTDNTAANDYFNNGGANSTGTPFTLTAGIDEYTGTSGNDVVRATTDLGAIALTGLDTLNGGDGTDTLKFVHLGALNTTVAGSTISSFENVDITANNTVTTDTTTWAGTTSVRSTSIGGAGVTAAATTDVTVAESAATLANGNITVTGGKNVTVNATSAAANATDADANAELVVTGAAGTVNVTASAGLADTLVHSNIAVTGGTSVTVTERATNAVNTTNTQGAVAVTGGAATTNVTVNQDAAATAAAAVVGKVNGAVTIVDVNAASNTVAGTISTVTLNSYGASTINSSAIATVNLSGTGGTLGVGRGDLTAVPTANTLAINTNALTGGAITDDEAAGDNGFTTINLANTGTSVIANLTAADLTTLNISGSGSLTLTANALGGATTTAIVSTSTGNVTLGGVLDVATAYTGGAGVDTISVGASTKAINLGGGNDVLTITAVPAANGTFNGGTGTNTIVANMATSSLSASTTISNFQTLRAGAAAAGAHSATGFTALEVGAIAANSSFTGVAAGVGLTQLATLANDLTVTLADATGAADSFTLTLSSAGAIGAAGDTITLAGIETVNVRTVDTDATAHVDTVALIATSAKTVNVSGNAGLVYSAADASITSFNASGVVLAAATDTGVTFDSLNITVGEVVSITGSNGVDVLTGSASANDTISAGAGADTITYDGGTDVFTGGAGNDAFVLAAGAIGSNTTVGLTITDLAVGDTINLAAVTAVSTATPNGALGAKVTLGAAATLAQYLDAAAAAVNGNGVTADVKWFQFGGNTYLVADDSAATTFAGTDTVVKIAGVVDLSTSTLAAEVLTVVAPA